MVINMLVDFPLELDRERQVVKIISRSFMLLTLKILGHELGRRCVFQLLVTLLPFEPV